ncbi:MAG: T9SS type A sorting domain-containing protein [Prevotellaceae bacterium]|jgi:hypothetical protein|nr:T9SS type A sorting domain-containing protein [Prevotellaceae bacterium]
MNARSILPILFAVCVSQQVYAQLLNSDYNCPRSGDRLIKRQIEAIEAGQGGQNRQWDFSELELPEANYELSYSAQGADTIIGTEHRTMYYYRLSGDSLFCIGYENPTTLITYRHPELLLVFPLFQGRTVTDYFDGTGVYCDRLALRQRGKSIVKADASGTLLLPGNDTPLQVIRTYTRKQIHLRMMPMQEIPTDTLPFVLERDSIDYLLAHDSIRTETQTWRWYADGYRYPVLETIKTHTYKFGKPLKFFTSSFIYLPEEQYYDLPYDVDNQQRRDEAAEEESKRQNNHHHSNKQGGKKDKSIDYQFGVGEDGNLHIDYTLKHPTKISITLYDLQGRQWSAVARGNQGVGSYSETISLTEYPRGEYLLRIEAGKEVFGEKILKP